MAGESFNPVAKRIQALPRTVIVTTKNKEHAGEVRAYDTSVGFQYAILCGEETFHQDKERGELLLLGKHYDPLQGMGLYSSNHDADAAQYEAEKEAIRRANFSQFEDMPDDKGRKYAFECTSANDLSGVHAKHAYFYGRAWIKKAKYETVPDSDPRAFTFTYVRVIERYTAKKKEPVEVLQMTVFVRESCPEEDKARFLFEARVGRDELFDLKYTHRDGDVLRAMNYCDKPSAMNIRRKAAEREQAEKAKQITGDAEGIIVEIEQDGNDSDREGGTATM